MGVFLFNVSTDDLEDEDHHSSSDHEEGREEREMESESDLFQERPTDSPGPGGPSCSTPSRPFASMDPSLTPVQGRPVAATGCMLSLGRNGDRARRAASRRIVYSSEEEEAVPPEYSRRNLKWRERKPRTYKYVDDNLQLFRVNMETAMRGQDPLPYRSKHAVACQNQFRKIIWRAEERGMKANKKKTAMVCASGAQSYEARAHI